MPYGGLGKSLSKHSCDRVQAAYRDAIARFLAGKGQIKLSSVKIVRQKLKSILRLMK
ncbi:MAG: hypothetical protein SW833_20750 [Cyanobacteriota bacterium]|nr:hypothetical protein [Cyanobacteriota bacterium]